MINDYFKEPISYGNSNFLTQRKSSEKELQKNKQLQSIFSNSIEPMINQDGVQSLLDYVRFLNEHNINFMTPIFEPIKKIIEKLQEEIKVVKQNSLPETKLQSLEKELVLQKDLWKLHAYTVFNLLSISPSETMKDNLPLAKVISEIFEFRDMKMRYRLINNLLTMENQDGFLVSSLVKMTKLQRQASLLINDIVSNEFSYSLIKNSLYKDKKKRNELFNFFIKIHDMNNYSKEEKEKILSLLLNTPQQKQAGLMYAALNAERFSDFMDVATPSEINESSEDDLKFQQFFKKFGDFFPFEESKLLKERFLKTFATFRRPEAIYTYYDTISNLNFYKSHQQDVLESFKKFVRGVLLGTFHNERYDITSNKHLDLIFNSKEDFLKKWITPTSLKFKEGEIQATESDDPCDLLLIGTEVLGSCLSVDGEPDQALDLLAYLLDGKIKALVVKNDKGEVIMRTMLKILWDPVQKSPVLFFETFYANVMTEEIGMTIVNYAIERAKDLKLPLLSSFPLANKENYENKIISIDSPAPSERVDAIYGSGKYGKYEIPSFYLYRI